ncbi:hypothetical protein MMC13_003606 [Lambiella insularis]|nr:hypothetical protein [Lambiella insularis]
MTPLPDIPLDSPLRTHQKRDLPQSLASTYAHGHISGHPRSPAAQRAFEARKLSILRSMTAEQIEVAYQETVKKVTAVLEEDRKKKEEVDREVEKLTKQREMERRIFRKMKGGSVKGDGMLMKDEGDP